jgi:hypothetical protein
VTVFLTVHLSGDAADTVMPLTDRTARNAKLADKPYKLFESLWGAKSPYAPSRKRLGAKAPVQPFGAKVSARMPSIAVQRQLHARDGYHCRFCGIPVIRKQIRQHFARLYAHLKIWGRKNVEQHAAFQAMWGSIRSRTASCNRRHKRP